MTVSKPDRVELYGTTYKIIGEVQSEFATEWAPKQVIGDYSKDDALNTSSWIQEDWTGGIGVLDLQEYDRPNSASTNNRCWTSTCNIDYEKHLLLPTLVTDHGSPSGVGECTAMAIFAGSGTEKLYVAFGTKVYSMTATGAWSASALDTLPAAAVDAVVYNGALWFASTTKITKTTDGAAYTDYTQNAIRLIEWNENLFALSDAGALIYTVDDGANWVSLISSSTLDEGDHQSLFLGRNVSGDVIIYMGTAKGLWALDYDNARWVPTEVTVPHRDDAGQGALVWRDAIYYPVGTGIYEYVVSNPAIVTPMGMDRDAGLEADYVGCEIYQLAPGHNGLYAITRSNFMNTNMPRTRYPAIPNWNQVIPQAGGYVVVFKWTGKGWSIVYVSDTKTTDTPVGIVGTIRGHYRLWLSTGEGLGKEMVSNSGAGSQSDWVDADGDGIADSWSRNTTQATGEIVIGTGWTGNAQKISVVTSYTSGIYQDIGWANGTDYTVSFKYMTSTGVVSAVIKDRGPGGSGTRVTLPLTNGSIRSYSVVTSPRAGYPQIYFATQGTLPELTIDELSVKTTVNPILSIPLPKDLQNPLMVSASTHGSTCEHITPWFDADNAVMDKVATKFTYYTSGHTTTNESVTVSYAIDYSDTWTTLGSDTTDGEHKYSFVSGVGLTFKAMRFRYVLSRGSVATSSPDVGWGRLSYDKVQDILWKYSFVIDCTHDGGPVGQSDGSKKSPAALVTALDTAAETKTLGAFEFYRDSSINSYVRITKKSGSGPTGELKEGQYYIVVEEKE